MGEVLAIVSAPSNLGLRPPEPGAVPGTAKAPEALRAAGLHRRLAATDGGLVLPGRYVDDDASRPAGRVRNQDALVDHARRLAARVGVILDAGSVPLVVGGDCSLLVGAGLALRRVPGAGLVHVDGHTDFRHPGNSDRCASVAGEDLAAAVGLHWSAVAQIDGRPEPYVPPQHVAHVGCRADDDELTEARAVLGLVTTAAEAVRTGLTAAAEQAAAVAGSGGGGYWLQVDLDVLDPRDMPAVDSPDAGELHPDQLVELLAALAPGAIGASVTAFDPDLDPDGSLVGLVVEVLARGFRHLGVRHRLRDARRP